MICQIKVWALKFTRVARSFPSTRCWKITLNGFFCIQVKNCIFHSLYSWLLDRLSEKDDKTIHTSTQWWTRHIQASEPLGQTDRPTTDMVPLLFLRKTALMTLLQPHSRQDMHFDGTHNLIFSVVDYLSRMRSCKTVFYVTEVYRQGDSHRI